MSGYNTERIKLTNHPSYKTDLVLKWEGDGLWSVYAPFIVNHRRYGEIIVPVGTLTDGPSIPKIPVLYERYRDRAWPPAAVHDYGYDKSCVYQFPREVWDQIFHDLMDELYPGWISRVENDKEWAGVRLGGSRAFRRK
jgi:hypothetical protein